MASIQFRSRLSISCSSGLDLQRELGDCSGPLIIFISSHGDIPSSVCVMKAGAIEFPKPFGDQEVLAAISAALALDRKGRQQRAELAELQKHYRLLTPREREFVRRRQAFAYAPSGTGLNKHIMASLYRSRL
jgi:FixJ family two-component response regulator